MATENTLFLLDEPDTYLHPKWQRDFVRDILIQGDPLDSKMSFIINSHSPNIISGLRKKQLKDFYLNPYGKPVDDLLIDLFNLDGLRFIEVDEAIEFLEDFLYSDEYDGEVFNKKLEELGNDIGKDDIDYLKLKLEKAKRDKDAKNS